MVRFEQIKARLKASHYVRKATPRDGDYWFDFKRRKYEQKLRRMGARLKLIVYGDDETTDDFYVFPVGDVSDVFRTETLHVGAGEDHQRRWMAHIRDHRLALVGSTEWMDVSGYHGNHRLLAEALADA